MEAPMDLSTPQTTAAADAPPRVDYRTDPSQYRHWSLAVEGTQARLTLDIAEDAGIRPGYKLKLNSYDLGVDIELADALNRVRFEHPTVRTVIVSSGKDRVFCSGANIFMLGVSSHAWKVNFCKFTNETRNGIEDTSEHSGVKFVAAVNGACAGGGYELALACDEIVLVDDRSSSVSLPEVPLLGVLPGTGGLTRVTDKRKVRHDLADIFCTSVEGVRGQRAVDWKLVDAIAKPARFAAVVQERAEALAATSPRPADARGIALPRIERADAADGVEYRHVGVAIDRARRVATITVRAPAEEPASDPALIEREGAAWWPIAMARELDDAILHLRTNELEIGTWILKTTGNADHVVSVGRTLFTQGEDWLVRETTGLLRRTFARLDVSSRTLFALVEPGSCFAGLLAELAFCADRTYMLALPDDAARAPKLVLDETNFGLLPMVDGQSRLQRRFHDDTAAIHAAKVEVEKPLDADAALALGLVTAAPDDIDWDDEIRIALEERAAMSPDALTGLEANLRFGNSETMLTRIFGRLTAWQNWIFQRPNAVGATGALKVYGTGQKAGFDLNRV
jgi:benzoyl-CoA-dihydrodiol lyase